MAKTEVFNKDTGAEFLLHSFSGMVFPGESKVLQTLDFIKRYTADPRPMQQHRKYSTEGFDWQEDVLNDMSRDFRMMKCSQVGASEVIMRKSAVLSAHHGLNIGYVLPSKTMMDKYAPSRVRPIIMNSRRLKDALIQSKPSNVQYAFTNGATLYLLYSSSDTMAISIAMDGVVLDEYDRCDPELLDFWPQRLGASTHKLQLMFSTPTAPKVGIHAEFLKSNQQYYMHKCGGCGHWQDLGFINILFRKGLQGMPDFYIDMPQRSGIDKEDWKEKFRSREPYIGCIKCSKEINRSDRALKEWVPKHPDRKVSGYSISRFHVPKTKANEGGHDGYTIINDLFRVRGLKQFYNQVLGQPYATSRDSISEEDVKSCIAEPGTGFDRFPDSLRGGQVFMGVDQGDNVHVVIIRIDGHNCDLVYAEEFSMSDMLLKGGGFRAVIQKISDLIRRFSVTQIVVDAAPDINFPKTLARKYRNKSSYARFMHTLNDFSLPDPEKDKFLVNVNRNWILGEAVNIVKKVDDNLEFRFPANFESSHLYAAIKVHFSSMVRVETISEDGLEKVEVAWLVNDNAPNHFLFATAYAILAYNIKKRKIFQAKKPLGIDFSSSLIRPSSPTI